MLLADLKIVVFSGLRALALSQSRRLSIVVFSLSLTPFATEMVSHLFYVPRALSCLLTARSCLDTTSLESSTQFLGVSHQMIIPQCLDRCTSFSSFAVPSLITYYIVEVRLEYVLFD